MLTRSPSPVRPSYKSGYARSAAESAYPELWDGLVGAWLPYGATHVHDLVKGGKPTATYGSTPGTGRIISANADPAYNDDFYRGPHLDAIDTASSQAASIGAIGLTRSAGEPFTAFVVFQRDASTTGSAFACRNGSGAGDLWKIYGNSSTGISAQYDPTGSGATVNAFNVSWKNPYAVLMVYDGSYIRLYVNGTQRAISALKTSAAIDQDKHYMGSDGTDYHTGLVGPCMVWSRAINASEAWHLSRDPLAPFRKRRKLFFGTTVEAATTTTTGGIIKTRSPSPVRPSYKSGFARSAAESAYPELWDGLVGAWVPALGATGNVLHDLSGKRYNGTLTNMAAGSDWDSSRAGLLGLELDGTNQSIPTKKQSVQRCTITFYGYDTDSSIVASQFRTYFSQRNDAKTNKATFAFDRNCSSLRGIRFYYNTSGTWKIFSTTVGSLIKHDRPQVISCTYDGASDPVAYFDGEQWNFTGGSGHATLPDCDSPATIGWFEGASGSDKPFQGAIYCVLLHDRPLKPDLISLLHRDPFAPFRKRRKLIFSTQAAAGGFNAFWASRATVVAPPINIGGF